MYIHSAFIDLEKYTAKKSYSSLKHSIWQMFQQNCSVVMFMQFVHNVMEVFSLVIHRCVIRTV